MNANHQRKTKFIDLRCGRVKVDLCFYVTNTHIAYVLDLRDVAQNQDKGLIWDISVIHAWSQLHGTRGG